MPLTTVTSGLGQAAGQATNTVSNTTKPATDTVQAPIKPVADTVQSTTSTVLPGTFPKEEPPTNAKNNVTMPSFSQIWTNFIAWLKGLIPRGIDIFEAAVRRFVTWLIPPERQAAMYKAAIEHPIASTFLAAQLLCVGIPLVLFIAGTLIFAAVAMLVWVVLSLLILGPIMLVASLMGISLWGWAWFVFGLVRWLDKLFLGGMMERHWVAAVTKEKEEEAAREREREEKEKEQQEAGGEEQTDIGEKEESDLA
ncbi:hypothetical protein BJX63DRAFT_114504 [Aspergillus granulosus]|uniref:Uncharacterized protein n=1 Tax=Aspergillus granulosus TaxID=176169 RepID=A0ABR4GTN9_9EURO